MMRTEGLGRSQVSFGRLLSLCLGIRKTQSRSHVHTSGPQLGIICILGALGLWLVTLAACTLFGSEFPAASEMRALLLLGP